MINANHDSLPETEPSIYRVLNIQIQFLAAPDQTGTDISIMRTVIPTDTTIPLHSHADPEIFYLLAGAMEVFQERNGHGEWKKIRSGEMVSIPGGIKHAIRNTSSIPVISLVTTKMELYLFFRTLSRPVTGEAINDPSATNEMDRLFASAEKYGYWLASPQENAAIGIFLKT